MVMISLLPQQVPTVHTQSKKEQRIAVIQFEDEVALHIPGKTWYAKKKWLNNLYDTVVAALDSANEMESNDTD